MHPQHTTGGSRRRPLAAARSVFFFGLTCAGLAAGQVHPHHPVEQVEAPQVTERVAADYPSEELLAKHEARVVLLVTVGRDGSVTHVEVGESGGASFDAAATAAAWRWRFAPARRAGEPVASRIRVPFEFNLPGPAPASAPPAPSRTAPDAARSEPEIHADPVPSPPPRVPAPAPIEVRVRGERELRSESRSVGDFQIERAVLAAAPRQEGAEMLRTAPGLYVGRGEGPAVAHSYMLRGFDAEHGQDIEFRVGGLPINQPSHLHGQGYADLGFLIAETVHELRVSEGVYDPRQGDFAVAGSIDVDLGVESDRRGITLRSGYGSFGTFRQLVLWAPRGEERETFGAVQYGRTDGFGENRNGESGSGIVQYRFGSGRFRYRMLGIATGSRSTLAGVLRAEDIDSGRVCFDCVYPYPTARAQNATATRAMVGVFAEHRGESGANGEVGFWLDQASFRLQENFTGFVQRSRTLAQVAGRGDLIEQQNRARTMGLTARHRTAAYHPTAAAHGTLEVGLDARFDVVDQAQNLLDATVRSQTWDQRVDASVRGLDLGFWGDLDWHFTRYLRARLGFRADILSYEVDDRLGNFAPTVRPQDAFIVGFRRSALGVAWGPRTSAEVRPLSWLSLLAAYGEGYRSPQARTLDDGEEAPFTKVRSADVGARFDWGDPLRLSVGGYYTHVSDDVAFDADEGRLERIGATRRAGAVVHLLSRPAEWLVESLSVTFVNASLLEPPPATPEEPQPPFIRGQSLPFVPPVVVREDLGVRHTFVDHVGIGKLDGRAGFGLSFLSPRPLPYGGSAAPIALFDASAGVGWGPLDLGFDLYNLLDQQYAALEYNFASHWDPEGPRTRSPVRHIAAGAPRTWMLTLGATL